MRLIDIDFLKRENELLKLKLKEAHDWIRHMGDWDKYKKRSRGTEMRFVFGKKEKEKDMVAP